MPPQLLTGRPAAQKSSGDLLDASMVSATSRFLEEQQAAQQVCVGGGALGWSSRRAARGSADSSSCSCRLQLIVDQQDQQLEMVSGSIRVLKHMSGRVGEELDEQGL